MKTILNVNLLILYILILNTTPIALAYFTEIDPGEEIQIQPFSDISAANKSLEFLYSLLPLEYASPTTSFESMDTPEIVLYESILDLYLISQSKESQDKTLELPIWNYQAQTLSNFNNYFNDYSSNSTENNSLVTPPTISLFELNNTLPTLYAKQIIKTYYSVLPKSYKQGQNETSLQVESIIKYILELDSIKQYQKTAKENNINWSPVAANSFEKISITESTLSGDTNPLDPSSQTWRNHLILFIRPPAPKDQKSIDLNKESYTSFKNYLNLKQEGIGDIWDEAYSPVYQKGLTMTSDDIKVGLALIDGNHAAEHSLLEKIQALSDSNLSAEDKFIVQQILFNSTNPTLALRGMRYIFKNDNGQNYDFISANITHFDDLQDNEGLKPNLKLYINGVGYLLVGQQINPDAILETWIQFEAEGFTSLLNNSPRLKQYWEQNALDNIDVGPIGTSFFNKKNHTELGAQIWISDLFLLIEDIKRTESAPFLK